MKRRTLRKIEKNEPKMIFIKLIFLVILILFAFTTPLLFKNIQTKKVKKSSRPSLKLPQKIDFGKIINFKNLQEKGTEIAEDLQTQILGKTTTVVEKTASRAASAVSETVGKTVFDTAIKPIVKQIDNLPEDQQRRARELICK